MSACCTLDWLSSGRRCKSEGHTYRHAATGGQNENAGHYSVSQISPVQTKRKKGQQKKKSIIFPKKSPRNNCFSDKQNPFQTAAVKHLAVILGATSNHCKKKSEREKI